MIHPLSAAPYTLENDTKSSKSALLMSENTYVARPFPCAATVNGASQTDRQSVHCTGSPRSCNAAPIAAPLPSHPAHITNVHISA